MQDVGSGGKPSRFIGSKARDGNKKPNVSGSLSQKADNYIYLLTYNATHIYTGLRKITTKRHILD